MLYRRAIRKKNEQFYRIEKTDTEVGRSDSTCGQISMVQDKRCEKMSDRYRNSRARGKRSRQLNSADRIIAVQNARNRGTASGRRRGRRQGPDMAKIILIAIGAVILLICAAVGFQSCARSGGSETADSTDAGEESTVAETEIEAEITVNGVQIHGLTKSEAMKKVLADMGWAMKVSFEDHTEELPNLMEANVDAVIGEALAKKESGNYTVETDGLDDAVQVEVKALAAKWDVKPKNGSISSYDKASDKFTFAGAQVGKKIDQEKLTSDIISAMKAGEYTKTITATANEVQPEISEEQAKEQFKRIGTFTTKTTTNKDRNENIRLACAAINGTIIQPGEEFSFNKTTGNRTTEKGYKPAGAYSNGVLVQEPGGGVCQVSSTLYNAVVFAGLKTTERHAHTYEPSYVTPGEDAMVSYDGYAGPDLRFVNNSKTAVGIKAAYSKQTLTVSIYGTPILEDGVTVSMHSEKIKELDPPAPTYVEDPTLQPGTEVVAKAATPGSRWQTNLIKKKNGQVVSDVLLHNSTYTGKAATIRRNTSGTMAATETAPSDTSAAPSESAAETTAPAPSETTAGETTAGETTEAPPAGENYGPGYETTAAPMASAETNQAPSDP